MTDEIALRVRDLEVAFATDAGDVEALRGVSLDVARGEAVALVGESGAGKSVLAAAVLRVLPQTAAVRGAIELEGRPILDLPERSMRSLRGDRLAMVPQEPASALDPAQTIGAHVVEAVRLHHAVARTEARRRAIAALRDAGLADAEERADAYPHQLPAGARQSVAIALALVNAPAVLVADEPTGSLDPIAQARALDRLAALRAERRMAVLLATNDLELAGSAADRIVVLLDGRAVEHGPAARVLDAPVHPYTQALVACAARPRLAPLVSRKQRRDPLPTVPGPGADRSAPRAGCVHAGRCAEEVERCAGEAPPEVEVPGGGAVRCWRR